MNEETIPLCEGEPSGFQVIIPETTLTGGPSIRSRPGGLRKTCSRVIVCFSPELSTGRIDHAECPVENISRAGIRVQYDGPLPVGTLASVSYRTDSGRPVHVTGAVRWCSRHDDGSYLIGLKLDRNLKIDETKPARIAVGREVAPGLRARKLAARTPSTLG